MIETKLANKLTEIATQQLAVGLRFKEPRMKEIQKSISLYNNKTEPALKGRKNVPLPVMSGFVETLKSEIDDPINIKFKGREDADKRKGMKVQSAFEMDTSINEGDWATADLDQKSLAIFSGRGISKTYSASDPYKAIDETIDYIDFVCEPKGGAYLENHLYHGQTNILRTKSELLDGVKGGWYDKAQVRKLVAETESGDFKKNETLFNFKADRMKSLGLDSESHDYVGVQLYSLTEWIIHYDGKQYYLFFDHKTGTWIRCELLKDVFSINKTPFVSWATHRDPFNFWSKGPCDDMQPVCKSIHQIFNQALEAREKGIWFPRAFDPKMFPDPSQLQSRPDALVQAKVGPGQKIQDGIYEFRTPSGEVAGNINLISFLDSFVGQKTGVTPSGQGQAEEEKKVGIYYGDLTQISKRMGVYNKSYKKCQAEKGMRYVYGLKDHMEDKRMVQILGIKGLEDNELLKDDLSPNFDIIPSSSRAEAENDELKKKSRQETLAGIILNPMLAAVVSPKWTVEEMLRNGGYDDGEIKIAMDLQNEGDKEVILMAAEENEDMYNGKPVHANKKATTAHLQRHKDFMDILDNEIMNAKEEERNKKEEVLVELSKHFMEEVPIATENAQRLAQGILMQRGMGTPSQPYVRGNKVEEAPLPAEDSGTPLNPQMAKETAQKSAAVSEMLIP